MANTVVEVLFGILFFVFVICPCIFICQTPLYDEGAEVSTMRQLRIQYEGKGYSEKAMYCDKFFGSRWNICCWLCPI